MAHARVSERNFLRRYAALPAHATESDAQSGWGEAESWASLVDAERRAGRSGQSVAKRAMSTWGDRAKKRLQRACRGNARRLVVQRRGYFRVKGDIEVIAVFDSVRRGAQNSKEITLFAGKQRAWL